MNKLLTVSLVLLASVAILFAGNNPKPEESVDSAAAPYYYTLTDYAVNGAYILTNDRPRNWELANFWCGYPGAYTNTLTISILRTMKTVTLLGDVVTTNAFGEVETNKYNVISSTSTFVVTNSYFTGITNGVSQMYDWYTGNRLPRGFRIINGDVLVFGFSFTNGVRPGFVDFCINGR